MPNITKSHAITYTNNNYYSKIIKEKAPLESRAARVVRGVVVCINIGCLGYLLYDIGVNIGCWCCCSDLLRA